MVRPFGTNPVLEPFHSWDDGESSAHNNLGTLNVGYLANNDVLHKYAYSLKTPVTILIFLMTGLSCWCQTYFTEAYIAWDDSFDQWEIVQYEESKDEHFFGELALKWPLRGNWNEWKFRIGDLDGEIRRKWPDLNDQWELNSYEELVVFNPKWRNDLNEWVVKNDQEVFTFKTKIRNNPTIWTCEVSNGYFEIFTSSSSDPREWIIEDYLPEEVKTEIKLALIFISLYHSFPK